MKPYQDLEKRIREIGNEIYSSMENEVPRVFDRGRWAGKVMEWAMKDPAFKVQLFRFVDVLPSLKSDELAIRLLKEYFGETDAPEIIKWGIDRISRKGFLSHIEAMTIRAGVESLAKQFIAGKDPEDALISLGRLRREKLAFSVDLLGEAVVSDREAGEYAASYLRLLDFLGQEVAGWEENPLLEKDNKGQIPRIDISLKISSFCSQFDPLDWEGSIENVKEGLRPIFKRAEKIGASICFDMEHYYYKSLTIEIFKSILEEFKDYPYAGIAIQAYLKDTREDLLSLVERAKERGRRIAVRLVKGAYWDYEVVINRQKGWPVPVFLNKEETDMNYEELTEILLENSEFIRPAVATHNIRSISRAIAAAEALNLPKEAFEFQMLYGMAEPVRRALEKMNYRVRVYTPVGELIPGMAYLVRRLLENASDESFLRRSFFEKATFEELMEPPRPKKKALKEGPGGVFRNEPPLDFSIAANREKMRQALEKVKGEFNKRYLLSVGGSEINTGQEIISFNPARPDEIVGIVSSATRKEAEEAVEEARKSWETWRKRSSKERADYLFRAAEEMRTRREELAALEVYEAGKTWKDADGDVTEAIDYLEYYGREMIRLGGKRSLSDYPGEENDYFYEPRGVGVVISPWNFPLAIPTGMVSAGIVTGNCVIFKPSGLSPVIGSKLSEIFKLSGLPRGVLRFLPGSGEEIGEYVVSHRGIDFVAFTGSKDVGLRIVKLAAETQRDQKNVKKVIAEMGGKNAIIVDETADLDEAVKGIIESAFVYQGQKCSACSRVIVVGEHFDEFCDRLKAAAESIKIGPPERPGSFMGPLIDRGALEKVKRYIEIGKEENKPLLLRRAAGDGYFIGPVIFADVNPDSPIARDEIFGPVLAVMRAASIDKAISIANNTVYALTGGLFSRSPGNIEKAKVEFRVGNLYINRKITGALVGRQPFGGFGMSGVGSKAGGPDYLLQFMSPRSTSENTIRRGFAPLRPTWVRHESGSSGN